MPSQEPKNVSRKDMRNVKCFKCKKFGQILANSRNNKINNFKKNNQPKKEYPQRLAPLVFRYKNLFYGYCFLCNDFGHKNVDCRTYGVRSRNEINKRYANFLTFHGHIRCYIYDNLGHKAKD